MSPYFVIAIQALCTGIGASGAVLAAPGARDWISAGIAGVVAAAGVVLAAVNNLHKDPPTK